MKKFQRLHILGSTNLGIVSESKLPQNFFDDEKKSLDQKDISKDRFQTTDNWTNFILKGEDYLSGFEENKISFAKELSAGPALYPMPACTGVRVYEGEGCLHVIPKM